jgi:integrase
VAKQDIEFKRLWHEARRAAQAAAEEQNSKLGDQDDCGFRPGFDSGSAWLSMPRTLAFGRWAEKAGITNDYGLGDDVEFWDARIGDEIRALRRLQRESAPGPFLFVSERGAPFTPAGFAKLVERAGAEAGFDFKAHPQMLRHGCGFALANAGHDTRALQAYLGHRNIQHTVRYTELAPNRFKDFWR